MEPAAHGASGTRFQQPLALIGSAPTRLVTQSARAAPWPTIGEIVMVRPDTTVTVVPARFAIEAGSRFPRLGIDYDSVIHKYTNEYISPRSYRVYIDAFPGGSITTLE